MKYCTIWSVLLSCTSYAFGDWHGFRGTNGNGFADLEIPPNLSMTAPGSWKTELPGRGLSSPIVVEDLVFITASSGPQQRNLHIIACNAESGKLVWEKIFRATGRTICHDKTCVAASTMISNGQIVIAQFSSNDVFCLDLKGDLIWLRGLTFDYPNIANGLGMSSSPVLANGVLIAQVENDADSFTFGLNVKNGTTLWKKNRPRGANWTSPVVLNNDSMILVGLQSKAGISFIEPSSGESVWNYLDGAATIPSSTIVRDNSVVVPSNGLTALQIPAAGKEPIQIWRNNKLAPGTGSPAISGDKLFVINRANVLTSALTASGEIKWRLRLKGPISASPITTQNLLFVFSEEGVGQVVDISKEEGEIIQEIDLQDTILCTPAATKGALFLRSDHFLWKLSS